MSAKEPIFVFGASGHAKVVIDILEKQDLFAIACIADDDRSRKGETFCGYTIEGGRDELIATRLRRGIVAIGDGAARRSVALSLGQRGLRFVTAVHPFTAIGHGVNIGDGTVVMAGAVVNADSILGEHVVINTGATVDHDCRLALFVHVAPGAHLCGAVTVGEGSFICAGATIVPNRTVGARVTVGAGATVLHDVPDDVVATGTPARHTSKQRE